MSKTPIAIAEGDGIGPEITCVVRRILDAAGARIEYHPIEVGEKVYLRGVSTGIEPACWDILRGTKVFLKGPITTPRGGGYKSLNVTVRNSLGLYANVRPCRSYHPFIATRHPKMDLVIVRENEEDLYVGIEHRQTDQVVQCLKLISRPGCEKIVRYAFEYANRYGYPKVTCFVKDNIMKLADGLFKKVFDEIASEYPGITADNWIVDIGAARLADTPEIFGVIVMPNLYGDIMSDIAAQISGSVGLGGSANIGDQCAMFEAIHGSAPAIAGLGIANPSGMLLGAIMMLVHIGQPDVATTVHNAWLRTIEEGIHTGDIHKDGVSRVKASTSDFAKAVEERLGRKPERLAPVAYSMEAKTPIRTLLTARPRAHKDLVGIDIFIDGPGMKPDELGARLKPLSVPGLELVLISNRGIRVWPGGFPETFCTDHWRCRFRSNTPDHTTTHERLLAQMKAVIEAGFDFIKTENLCNFDGTPGYSLGGGD